jgi:hypothetical protein
MRTTRNAAEVIDRVLAEVPSSEIELRAALNEIREDSFFQPPESPIPWQRIRDVLLDRFVGETVPEGWALKVSRIVRGAA